LSSGLLSKNTEIKIRITIILLVVLYGCESWSVTLREEHKLRVSENRVQRRIFGPKREKVTWEGRIHHNEELNYLCSAPNTIFFFFCFWRDSPQWVMTSSFTRFLDHTQRHTTVGRTSLDE